jgi:MoaA/NifB/PqqE/SkfB family radical SAM enzyme
LTLSISKIMEQEKKYCAAPWRSLHLNFEGQIKTCCAGDPHLLGNHDTGTIEEILSSEKLKEIKSTLLTGVLHKEYCKNCIRREDITGISERQWHNQSAKDFDITTAEFNDHKPGLIDIRWNNTCNLACNYCTEYFSTKWARIKKVGKNENIKDQYTKIINYIEQNKEHVREVALVGGEPLMMKENNALLDLLPDNVLITVISNMTIDFDTFPVPKKLLQRSRVGWSMSFDNIGDRFEYVRWGSSWNQLDTNVTKVSDHLRVSKHYGGIQSVYNIYNCTRLIELKEYAISKGIQITWQVVYGDQLDPTQHNESVRKLAIDEIEKYKLKFPSAHTDINFLNGIKKQLVTGNTGYATLHGNMKAMNPDNITRSKDFLRFTDDIENIWHPDQKGQFAKLWPDIAEAL